MATVARYAHLLEIGSASLADSALLQQLGRVDRPVVLFASPSTDPAHWLAAADRVRTAGNRQVALGIEAVDGVVDLAGIGRGATEGFPVIVLAGGLNDDAAARLTSTVGDAALSLGAAGLTVRFDVDTARALKALGAHLTPAQLRPQDRRR